MKEQYVKIIGSIINIGVIVLLFLTPLIFTPISQNINDVRVFSEFNKQVVFVGGSLILFSLWTVKMILEKRVLIIRTPIDLPLIGFLIIYLLATGFSKDIFVSAAGFYGIFHPSLISVLALVLLYFTAISNLNSKMRFYALGALLLSIVIVAAIHIFNFFGVFPIPYEVTKSRVWLPLLSLSNFAFVASLLIPISAGLALQSKKIWVRVVGLVFSLILFAPLLIINTFGAWVSLFAAVAVFLLFSPRLSLGKEQRVSLAVTSAIAILLIVVSLTPALRDNLIQPLIKTEDKTLSIPAEPKLSLENGWRVAASAVGERPFLGSGPATFPFVFTRHSSVSLNQTDDWNIRFEQASNEYVNLASTVGLLGLMAYLILLFYLLKPIILFCSKSGVVQDNPLIVFFLASLSGFVVGSLFFDTSLVVGIIFVLLASSSFSLLHDLGAKNVDKVSLKLVSLNAGVVKFSEDEKPSNNLLPFLLFIPSVLLVALFLFFAQSAYRAELSYQRSITSASENKANETRDRLLNSIRTFGYRDVYHRTLSLVDLRIAQSLSRQQDVNTEQNRNNLQLLVNEAIEQGKIASGYQNPTGIGTSSENIVNWESIAIVYSSLVEAAQNADVHSVQTYQGAIQRFPRNPLLFEALGNVYLRTNQTELAVRSFETAVSLKQDLAQTHYSLSQAYKQEGERDADVARELQFTLNLLSEGQDQDRQRIQDELDEVIKSLEKSQQTPSPATSSATPNP